MTTREPIAPNNEEPYESLFGENLGMPYITPPRVPSFNRNDLERGGESSLKTHDVQDGMFGVAIHIEQDEPIDARYPHLSPGNSVLEADADFQGERVKHDELPQAETTAVKGPESHGMEYGHDQSSGTPAFHGDESQRIRAIKQSMRLKDALSGNPGLSDFGMRIREALGRSK